MGEKSEPESATYAIDFILPVAEFTSCSASGEDLDEATPGLLHRESRQDLDLVNMTKMPCRAHSYDEQRAQATCPIPSPAPTWLTLELRKCQPPV